MSSKKTLTEKIAAAKAKLGKSSLLEVEDGFAPSDVATIEEALEALKEANAAFDANAVDHIAIEEKIKEALQSIQGSSAEEEEVLERLRAVTLQEDQTGVMMTTLQTTLRDAYEDLKEIDAKSNAAESESETSRHEADSAGAQLSSLLQRLQL